MAWEELRAFYTTLIAWYPAGDTLTADFGTDIATGHDEVATWATMTGTGAGAVAPPHIAPVITWKTSIRGRRARGRTFLGPVTNGAIGVDGTLNQPLQDNVKTAADALVAASLVDNGWALCIIGQVDAMPGASPAARAAAPHVARDITGWTQQDKFGVLRSRRPR